MKSLKGKIAALLATVFVVQVGMSWWLYQDYTRNIETRGGPAIHQQGMARARDFLARSLSSLQMAQSEANRVLIQTAELFTYSDNILVLLRKGHTEPLQHLAERMMANTELDAILVRDGDGELLASATNLNTRWLTRIAMREALLQRRSKEHHPRPFLVHFPEGKTHSPLWVTSFEVRDPFGDLAGQILIARDSPQDRRNLDHSARLLGVEWARFFDGQLIDGFLKHPPAAGLPTPLPEYGGLSTWGPLLASCSQPSPDSLQLCAMMPRSREQAWENEIIAHFDQARQLLVIYLIGDVAFFLVVVTIAYLISRFYIIRPIRHNTALLHRLLAHHKPQTQTTDELALLNQAVIHTRNLTRERQALAAHAEFETYHDDITRLPNRRALNEFIADLEDHPAVQLGVVFLRVRNFGRVHDQFGYRHADQALVELANSLVENLANNWYVFYLGHDRFLLVAIGEADLGLATHELLVHLKHDLGRSPHRASGFLDLIGAHVNNRDFDTDLPTLFQYAAIALNQNFDSPDEVFAVNTEQIATFHRQLLMESYLAEALNEDELTLYYQPVCRSGDVTLCYFEVLLRWNNPVLGEVPPSSFIPVAEANGLIGAIGQWTIRRACAQLARWDKQEQTCGVHLSLNISPLQLGDPGLADMILETLSAASIAPQRLILEITESAALVLDNHALDNLDQLRAAGIRLAIDDFGEGYSSLGQLMRLHADTLKIDRQFVDAIATDDTAQTVIRGFIELARHLRMDIVAEGVENAHQLELLRQAGCPAIQGYLVSRPVPAETAIHWYRQAGGSPQQRPRQPRGDT